MITGISGQDGHLLARELLRQGRTVIGLLDESRESQVEEISGNLNLIRLNFRDEGKIKELLSDFKPAQIFNLAGFSSVRNSFRNSEECFAVNYFFLERLLKCVVEVNLPTSRIFQCSSSEMYAGSGETKVNEQSSIQPISPYGISKASAHFLCNLYRTAFALDIRIGILFNHESPLRKPDFATKKIVKGLVSLKCDEIKQIVVSNLSSTRDWGYAEDFIGAMISIMDADEGHDYVVGTGQLHSIREFIQVGLNYLEIDREVSDVVLEEMDPKRLIDHVGKVADTSLIRETLGWVPKWNFQQMVHDLIDSELTLFNKKNN